MQAALAGFPDVVRLLASQGADVNARDVDGKTALMLAYDDKVVVDALLSVGADYQAKDKDGMTALTIALRYGQSAKAEALILAGAGKESVASARALIARPPGDDEPYAGFWKEDGYRILTEIYIKLDLAEEAVKTGKEALESLGDHPHLRARLGFTYLHFGDRRSALAQCQILRDRAARDKDTKTLYQSWAGDLCKELEK